MGQYFTCYTKSGSKETRYSLQFKGYESDTSIGYIGRRLTEHSYIHNFFCDYMSNLLYEHPMKISWVGDYAEGEFAKKVHRMKMIDVPFEEERCNFDYNGKFLVNHTKNTFIPFDMLPSDSSGYIMYPASLLTALGNDKGGGDYFGRDKELCGTWQGDMLSIEDNAPSFYTPMKAPNFAER